MCLCCAVARSLVQLCVTVLFAREITDESRHPSLSGSALPFPKEVTLNEPCGKNSHCSAPWESHVRGRMSGVRVRP